MLLMMSHFCVHIVLKIERITVITILCNKNYLCSIVLKLKFLSSKANNKFMLIKLCVYCCTVINYGLKNINIVFVILINVNILLQYFIALLTNLIIYPTDLEI